MFFVINFFSEMKPGALKSEFLLEGSCHRICCFLFFFQHLSQSFRLPSFVVNQVKLSLSQVRTNIKQQVLTKLNASKFGVFW
eukprot:UN04953